MTRHAHAGLALLAAALWAASVAEAQTCPTSFGSYSPCEVVGSAPAGALKTTEMTISFLNATGSSWNFSLFGSHDPSCPLPPAADHWLSFDPFIGVVASTGTLQNRVIDVMMDGDLVPVGEHRGYACLTVTGAPVVAIPVRFTVQQMCPAPFGAHTCVVSGTAAAGASTTAALNLVLMNTSGAAWNWILFPADDPSCSVPAEDHWASFAPFFGQVLNGQTSTPEITATLDAATLISGLYETYACLSIDGPAASTTAIPVTFAVDDHIFADGFEDSTLAAWSPSTATGGGDLAVSGASAMGGTTQGLTGVIDDTTGLFAQDDTPNDESHYRARFYLDPSAFDPGEAQLQRRTRTFIVFSEGPSRRVGAVVLRRQNGIYALMGRARLDDNAQADTGFFAITAEPHVVEIDLVRASGPDTLDGALELWIDGASQIRLTGLDNSLAEVDFARLGALSVKSGASGTLHWDEFVSRRHTYIGPLP